MLIALGVIAGVLGFWIVHRIKLGGFEKISADLLHRAEMEAETRRAAHELSLKEQTVVHQQKCAEERQTHQAKLQKESDRLKAREDKLEGRMNLVEKKLSDIERREAVIARRREANLEEKKMLAEERETLQGRLESLASMTAAEAREELLTDLNQQLLQEKATLIRKTLKETEEEADRKASSIIATAINRLAVRSVSEGTVVTVNLPNEEIKGRIIGREGRNIRALERVTGVTFLIDETPGAIVLSAFDPIRLHTAKIALQSLLSDGRIHPTRIEESVEKAKETIEKQIRGYGDDAAARSGVLGLHSDLIDLLGKLKFRYSYGQNILEHSLEVSTLMGIMAAELGLDVNLAKRIGLLHDIGKALTHEIEGTHAIIGHDIALRCGESSDVANGIGCHHQEMSPATIEASLCSAADALSAARPGARVEALEEYTRRMKELEELAFTFPGVDKVYAVQAGREIRIAVLPEMIDDAGTINLARDITKAIETRLNYPGKIKVTVIRERKAIEYAL